MEKIRVLSRLVVTVTCLVFLEFSVGMCTELDPLIKTVVSSSVPSKGDLLYSAKLDKVQNITESEWDSLVMRSELPVLVQFTADECRQCRTMDLILDSVEVRYTDRIKFYQIDFEKSAAIAKEFYVENVPTTSFFNGGGIMDEVFGSIQRE